MAFFLPQLRVGRLLPGHTDFETGHTLWKSPTEFIINPVYNRGKKKNPKQKPLHNPDPLFPIRIIVCCGVPLPDLM